MIQIVGLGNPGKKYQINRHNVGHMFIDYCKTSSSRRRSGSTLDSDLCQNDINHQELKMLKTNCFMNESGKFFKDRLNVARSTLHRLIVVHDDLDIPLGKFHIQFGVGPQLHNGLESIEQNLKSKDFWRLRIGIDARPPDRWTNGETYVLQNFLAEEKNSFQNEIFPKILTQLKVFLKTEFSLDISDVQL